MHTQRTLRVFGGFQCQSALVGNTAEFHEVFWRRPFFERRRTEVNVMSEFEDKISKILSSPEDMEKIMSMAKSFSSSLGTEKEDTASAEENSGVPDLGALTSMLGGGSVGDLLGNMDPKVFGIIGRVLSEYSSKTNDKTDLISAVKPYLKEDRREKIDKATDMARLARLARLAFSEFKGGEDNV
jgi:hypothetical protein